MQDRRLKIEFHYKSHRVFVVCFLSVACIVLSASPVQGAKPQHRRYDQGPLELKEFRTDTREAQPFKAMTMTRVMYDFKFDWTQTGANRYEAKLKSLDAFAVFLPNESWWGHRARRSLLDHEQGHFDIAEIAARRIRVEFGKAFRENKSISGSGKTMAAAKLQLEKKLQKVFSLANAQSVEENQQYDLLTRHGNRYSKQDEVRRIQLLTLEKLEKQLSGKKSKKTTEEASK